MKKYEKLNIIKGVPDVRGRQELIKRMSKAGKLDMIHFDFSSFAERPLRSKHADYLPAWGPAIVQSELYGTPAWRPLWKAMCLMASVLAVLLVYTHEIEVLTFLRCCSRRYARFDHYCPFSDCVVGQRNHVYFFQYVGAIVLMSVLFVYLSARFVVKDCGPTGAHSAVFSVFRWLVCRPWVSRYPCLDLIRVAWYA